LAHERSGCRFGRHVARDTGDVEALLLHGVRHADRVAVGKTDDQDPGAGGGEGLGRGATDPRRRAGHDRHLPRAREQPRWAEGRARAAERVRHALLLVCDVDEPTDLGSGAASPFVMPGITSPVVRGAAFCRTMECRVRNGGSHDGVDG